MKLFHLSDMHIGKRFGEYSWIDDQKYILIEILNEVDKEKPDGVIIAGDLYDKPVPSAEAVALVDDFLTRLAQRHVKVFVISGNHDSAERVAYGSKLMEASGVYLSPVYNGTVESIDLDDNISIYLLPFIKPVNVREFYPDEEIDTYNDALSCAISHIPLRKNRFNILVAHQFVTGAEPSDSEERMSVGGLDEVDASCFDSFDYVALGHIHKPQGVSRSTVRYSGTPLKYSFSEISHVKSITVLDIDTDKNISISTIPLTPRHDMRVIDGFFKDLMTPANYEGTAYDDYLKIVLYDEDEIPSAMDKLRAVYPNVLELNYDNSFTRYTSQEFEGADITKSELELFEDFYKAQNGTDLTSEQRDYLTALINDIWGYIL